MKRILVVLWVVTQMGASAEGCGPESTGGRDPTAHGGAFANCFSHCDEFDWLVHGEACWCCPENPKYQSGCSASDLSPPPPPPPPTITITQPLVDGDGNAAVGTDTIVVAGTVTGADEVRLEWSNSATSASGTGTAGAYFRTSPIALAPGRNPIVVKLIDTANAVSQIDLFITRDATPPVVGILEPTESELTIPSPNLLLRAIASDDYGTVHVTWHDDPSGRTGYLIGDRDGTWLVALSLLAGDHTLRVVATDAVGNATSTPPITVHVNY